MSGHTGGQPEQGVGTSTRSRMQRALAQATGSDPPQRSQSRRRRLSVRLLPEQPPQPQAGSCIDLTESVASEDDDDEPILLDSKRSSSPVVMQQRPSQQSKPSSSSKSKRKRAPQCGICMEDFKSMACGPCGHVFCERCLREAVKAQKKCPTCRKTLKDKQIHRVYLQD